MKRTVSDKRSVPDPWDIGFGAVLFGLSLLALFVWFPLDIRGGFIEINHVGKPEPGDAFFPILLTSVILALSGFHILKSFFFASGIGDGQASGRLSRSNVVFLVLFHAIVVTGLALMYWLGPLIVALMSSASETELTYRQLVDTIPYKYIGYAVGGMLMTGTLIFWAEGRFAWNRLVIVALVIVASICIFDGLLNNVQLPPNADY